MKYQQVMESMGCLSSESKNRNQPPAVPTREQEPEMEVLHGYPEKKKTGKFQPFRKLFGKKKKKDRVLALEGSKVKASHSIGNLSDGVLSSDEETNDNLRAPDCTMGTRAFSHDSIFMPDDQEDDEQVAQTMSQDNILGKVKTLQPRDSSDFLTHSAMGREAEEKVTPFRSSHAKRSLASSGTIESINLDDVPQAGARLDNSAAKHKLLVKPRHQRLSKKHRRSTKDLQNVTDMESEENHTETLPYKETGQEKNEHISADQNHDMKRQKKIDIEEETRRTEEYERLCDNEEKKQQAEAEEKNRLENQRCKELEEQRKEQERRRLEEEKRQQLIEEEKRFKIEEQKRQEEERLKQEEQRCRELEECRRQEEQRLRELEEYRKQEEQRQHELEEEKRIQFEEKRRKEEQMQHEMEERRQKEEEKQHELEEQKRLEIEKQQHQEEEKRKQEAQRQQIEEQKQKNIEEQKLLEMQWQQQQSEVFRQQEEKEKMGEEMRWQELDQRQTMPKSYTFKVSSGEKQIIFEKVNLSPVTPVKELLLSSEVNEPTKSNKISHALPSALCVPHTAILVTGAQLCGPAVNLNQIKDMACKSILGLTEERKTMDISTMENVSKVTHESVSRTSKTKLTSETLETQSTLDELVSIRSRILKNAENGKILEDDQKGLSRYSDDWTPKGKGNSHSNLRKTLSASAKFSITPAWQKFSETVKANDNKDHTDTVKQTEQDSTDDKTTLCDSHTEDVTVNTTLGGTEDTSMVSTSTVAKQVKIMDSTEGCKFAKDLPSFLVPSLPQSPCKASLQSESPTKSETQLTAAVRQPEKAVQNVEEKMPPFGIKLRRTNYSLRFHSDQQSEQKKKKRYSAGDSFDGVPSSWITADCEREPSYVSGKQLASTDKELPNIFFKISSSNVCGSSHSTIASFPSPTSSSLSSISDEKTASKPQFLPKPVVAPKPPSHTPPSSPHARHNRSNLADVAAHKVASTDTEIERKREDNAVSSVSPPPQNVRTEEEEIKEKKSFFPSLNIPWREKSDRKPELIRKEKPVLQSRHSLDGSRLMEKVESAQPLWITLALQKQKGFREQQATREERKQAREAKQAEKLAKENINVGVANHSDNRSSNLTCTASTPQKPVALKEDKKIETVVSWLERREQLKKSNTLPTSVTVWLQQQTTNEVEISDCISSTPLANEITKRFSTPDTTPMSTEPAWLALAKRKAKAWSDCPQIIKQIH
ncbi:capping protein-inhibiting regulator of actin dynamics isoform X2 [Microcaecilia unicolor]|uniref:Cancer-related regulator of actin dynamics isoform X2 n=1 Tax=Microcaecilia unicolor TaxID=1415580 RepID=A0A6P7X486_9AMPH|nr:cancer-related regulator of actin dynamics isoform X2 [Microcaecilia unicolor]